MTELALRENNAVAVATDPTGGRLVAWAHAASAANQLAKALTTTSFVPAAFKGNPADATAAILMGDELGLSPIAALRSIYVVHGTPAMYARTMVALAQSHGHEIWTEIDSPVKVTVAGRRKGSDKVERSEWTIDRARKAGYTTNKKYESQPQEMLWAKAAGTVARKVAADVLAGIPYSVEDLELDAPAATVTVTRQEPAKRTPMRRKQEPPPPAEPPLEPDDALAEFDPAHTSNPAPSDEPLTTRQRSMIHALYNQLDITDRDERLADIGAVVGRDVDSSNDLTKADASRLVDRLQERLRVLTPEAGAEDGALFGDRDE